MRFAAPVIDTITSLFSSSSYVPMSQHPDDDDDIELQPLTARESPRGFNRPSSRSSPSRARDASMMPVLPVLPVRRRSLLQVPHLNVNRQTASEPQSSNISLKWLQQHMPFAFANRHDAGPRHITVGMPNASFARNVTRNQK